MVNNVRSSGIDNLDIRNSNSGTSQTSCHEESKKDSASGELEYVKDAKDSPYKPIFLEEPQTQTQKHVTLECQNEIMSNQPKISSPPLQPSWTMGHWLKPGQMSMQSQQPATNDMPKAFMIKQNSIQRQKQLTIILSKPVEMMKAERMMQKMGWSGGALGKTGIGIVEPIVPNFIYANDSRGLGLSLEKLVKVKTPELQNNETEAPSSPIKSSNETAATDAAKETSPPDVPAFSYLPPVQKVDIMSKYQKMADKLERQKMQHVDPACRPKCKAKRTLKENAQKPSETKLLPESSLPTHNVETMSNKKNKAEKRKEIKEQYAMALTVRSRILDTLLDFVRNDNEVEIVFGSELHSYQRRMVHQLVNEYIPDDSGEPFGYGFHLSCYTDMVVKIRESNSFILKTQSYGEEDNRSLHVLKKAPNHVLLITPDDLREKTKENNIDLSTVVSDIKEINIFNRENKKNDENYDEINGSDLKSDEDYNIVGNRSNKEPKEKAINTNSVVCKSNVSGREDDKDKKVYNVEKQVIVKNKEHTIAQTTDKAQVTKTQNLLEEKAKNPITTNCEKKSTDDVARRPCKKKLSVAQQLCLSWAAKVHKQAENVLIVSKNNQCDTGKSDNVRLKELNLQNPKKEGTEVESQIKCDKDCRKIYVIEKLKEFFKTFTQNETYIELRFVGPFRDDEKQKINDLVTVVSYFFQTSFVKDDRFKSEGFLECLNQLCHSDFTLDITQNDNGNPIIRKRMRETNVQKNVKEID